MYFNKGKFFQRMTATDETSLEPESVVKNPQVRSMKYANGRKKQLREEKSSDSRLSAETKNIVIQDDNMISMLMAMKF